MKAIFQILILSMAFFTSCSPSEERVANSQKTTNHKLVNHSNITFDEFLNKIPSKKLPLNLQCERELEGSTFDFDQSVIDKFGQENSRIFGKIAETNKFAAVIYLYPADIVLPIIQTTDIHGNKISDLKIYETYCGSDQFSYGTSRATITRDLNITLSDSIIEFERNSEGEIIDETKKLEVKNRFFFIDQNGHITQKEK